ncbi:MAG: serpin family protein [Sedimentisphaerales bacterium]|nr:serpin family protein [Sedimentisphaerales bacterium]
MKAVRRGFILAVAILISAGCPAKDASSETKEIKEEIIVQGNNAFAAELYAKLRAQEGNLFFSPYSVSAALAMTYTGARGETEKQMADVLHFPSQGTEGQEQFHQAFGTIIKDLNARGGQGKYELVVANALWGQKGYEFLEGFLRSVGENYDGQLNNVDFAGDTESARKTINTWVEQKTRDKIKDLIPQGVLNQLTRLVLTNAIYFKGNWARQFEKEKTKDAPFTLIGGEKVNTPMMNQTDRFSYMEMEDFQGLELPYVDNELSMILFLPKQTDGLAELEKKLTAENLSQWQAKLRKREVIVSVPKFKETCQFSMADMLKQLGMMDAFTATADFSGMNSKKELFISEVIHKAFVEVNEEGTEAAAATGVVVGVTSVGPKETPVFRADHPFLFLIRDNNSGSILFMGRVMSPKQ